MRYTKTDNTYLLKIEQGEDVVSNITQFCERHDIKNAYVHAIGAVCEISCGYYALAEQQYHFKAYEGLYEVLSATGNVTLKDSKPSVHLHAVFSDETNAAFGGHVEEMRVGVVLEVVLVVLGATIHRELEPSIGLYLWHCDQK